MSAVRADDNPGVLGMRVAPTTGARDADDTVALDAKLAHREPFAQLDAGLDRRVDQDLVERRSPGTEAGGQPVRRSWRMAGQDTVVVIAGPLEQLRAAGAADALVEPELLQIDEAAVDDVVGGDRVARERGAIDQQHPMPLAREQHGSR